MAATNQLDVIASAAGARALGEIDMRLTAPRMLFFVISLIIAIVAVLSVFIAGMPTLPINNFWLMTIAYVILGIACLVP
jgi:hypothetical protein